MTTNEELERMTPDELDAWVEANAEGPWEPPPDPPGRRRRRPMTSVTLRMPEDLLDELRDRAARRGQPYQRYLRDVLLLGLCVLRERPSDVEPAGVRLTPAQLRLLNEQGTLTLRIEPPAAERAAAPA